jgi:hypothetical protein
MANPALVHSLGPTCAYYDEPVNPSDEPPPVRAQFFYTSNLPIDDPLSPLPPPSDSKTSHQSPQPFSARDNAALEEAWHAKEKLGSKAARHSDIFHFSMLKHQKQTPRSTIEAEYETPQNPPSEKERSIDSKSYKIEYKEEQENVMDAKERQNRKVEEADQTQRLKDVKHNRELEDTNHNPQLGALQSAAHWQEEYSPITSHMPEAEENEPVMLSQNMKHNETPSVLPADAKDLGSEQEAAQRGKPDRRRKFSPFRNRGKKGFLSTYHDPEERSDDTASSDISGRPFARAPSFRRKRPPPAVDGADSATDTERSPSPARAKKESQTFVPVGISRLHLVEMPAMLMKPIYWNPINDISSVTRGTWFYQDSMLPVEQEVALQLEEGYEAIRPWTEVWQEELDAIVKSGAADAELKAMHRLWPKEGQSRPSTATIESSRRALDGSFGIEPPDSSAEKISDTAKPYQKYSVIYLNAKEAQLLKPSLIPSESRGRKPLGTIRKGRQIGIPVVRGFNRTAWEKLHGRPLSARAVEAKLGAFINQSGDATTLDNRAFCPACKLDEQRAADVTDLVLVVHGIGQKLSERVDSYHFTHAINSFRREINVELADKLSRGSFTRENHGIMVLPVNWRLTVSFDDNAASKDGHENDFRMTDITPESLPAIRSLISDVMLDIPYYLSHHKDRMTSAVVKEANRVYRLWCNNNPGFQLNGKVHLIAHSLGSVMAMDILSKQPTTVSTPTDIKIGGRTPNDKTFEFNTDSLFNCGSPAGFFLLLNTANLVPRKGRKAGEDAGRGVAGEASYGCLAVNNIYNIVHRNDPIAYLQNACVDADYARSLVPAYIPSASTGLLRKIGQAVSWSSASSPSAAYQSTNSRQRPSVQHLPSTVELETHDFTREEIAEKRMFLLNDNGQIDFLLSPGGIQYLDMLGAHSSYWISSDFVRFLVMELGREPGKEGTLPILQAQKKREWKKGTIG